MDDDVRTCTTVDGFDIRERISDYSSERRTYAFRHAVPLPVEDSTGTFRVEPDGGGSQVVLETSFAALDPDREREVAGMMDGALQGALAALKRRVEDGARWDA
jgi:hypothetical protein